jgi:capsid portal protein
LETHLGWAGKVLGNQLQTMIDEQFSPDAKSSKQFKKVLYGKDLHDMIDDMNDSRSDSCCKN